MDKKDEAHTYNGVLLGHKKNEIVLFAETWADPETITQENQKNKYRILTLIYGI